MISINQITKNIFVGSSPKDEKDIVALYQKYQINSVISLQTNKDMQTRNLILEHIEKIYQGLGIEFKRFPIIDVDSADMVAKLIYPIRHLIDEVKRDNRIYVHCNAGICRASSTVLGYLYYYEGMSLKEGSKYIRERRPIANPDIEAVRQVIQYEHG